MNAWELFIIFLLYFSVIMLIAWLTSRGATSHTFFNANRRSQWYWVAFGMVGTSLSGITFMSVPGWVGTTQFSYMAMVMGYIAGYFLIAFILLPLYYKLNLPSIYSYLNQRFGVASYKTGAAFFILSRSLGAAFRMYIVINVLQIFVFDAWNIPFSITALMFLFLMLLYTYKGGVKTLVYTDTLQTLGMLIAVSFTIYYIAQALNSPIADLISQVKQSHMSDWFFWGDWSDKRHFLKQFLAGMFITLTMTGLDQEMMQKNLSCKSVGDAQKNMISYSLVIAIVNLMFLFLGALLYIYAENQGIAIPNKTDDLFPIIALQHIGGITAIIFLIGVVSAAFPSADGALTSLTTIFSIDILGLTRKNLPEANIKKTRIKVHIAFAALLYIIVVVFSFINNEAVISELFTVAGYTYGPLLGLYAFGLLTRRIVIDRLVPYIAILSPIICYLLNRYSTSLFGNYKFGFELILVNGCITFLLLLIFSKKK
ncbi:MAG: sodium:solute symporter [Bacteroidales bacterium]|nr:sodium:solute symporter [Bacteroidales bacterium]